MPATKERAKEWTPEQLKKFRIRRGWTQAEAAELIGITQGAWSHWERPSGGSPPLSKRKLLDVLEQTGLVSGSQER